MKKAFICTLLILNLISCSSITALKNQKSHKDLYSDFKEEGLKRSPIWATIKGDKRYNDRLIYPSEEMFKIDYQYYKSIKKRALSLPTKGLKKQALIDRQLFLSMLDDMIVSYELGSHYIQFSSRGGFHTILTMLPTYTPFKSLKDYEDYLSRLSKIPGYFNANMDLALIALKKGYRYPQGPFKGFDKVIKDMISSSAKESLFYKPFIKMNVSHSISKQAQNKIKKNALKIITEKVTPSYKKFYHFWKKNIEPEMRKNVSISSYPQGHKLYEQAVKFHTSLTITSKQIHSIGLSEVKRIRNEMTALMRKVNFKGSLKDFIKDLRTNPRFYPKTKKELLNKTKKYLANMNKMLPKYFGKLPKSSYQIKEIPAYKAAKETTAYYMRPSPKTGRPGYYFVNTSQLDQRPLYEVEALSYHEAVPGHHLQIALQQELKNIPDFRKNYNSTAFVEGWGLYSESLAKEMGFYKNPYSDFGRLTYEIWRASRLVVDTGLHAFNWSRSKAIKYMVDNTALSQKNIEVEIDRYITRPGQALAYKLGELKIKELKAKSKKALGEKFDIKSFHDAVLAHGPVPLKLLEDQIDRWIKKNI